MVEKITYSVYGIPPRTPEEREEDENEMYAYIKALVEAEKINPDDDWDGIRATKLLRKIAESPLREEQRKDLVALLDYGGIDDED